MKIEAVKVRRLYLQVAEQLARFVSEGELKPGDRLPSERDLAQRFAVSRPTIREAMIALEISGLVEIRSGSGVYVLPQEGGLGVIHRNNNRDASRLVGLLQSKGIYNGFPST